MSMERQRSLITRADGKLVNVALKIGQIFVCMHGCCCGREDHGFPGIPEGLYHREWVRRKLRNKVHLTEAGCLGPCPLANVVMILFDGRPAWFHSMQSEHLILALFDYVEGMLERQAWTPVPPVLEPYAFNGFRWDGHGGSSRSLLQEPAALERTRILVLTQADTDRLLVARLPEALPEGFPAVTARSIPPLNTPEDAAAWLGADLQVSALVVAKIIADGPATQPLLEYLSSYCRDHSVWLVCVPHVAAPDPALIRRSTIGEAAALEVATYLQEGGLANWAQCLRFLSDHFLLTGWGYEPPAPQPDDGILGLDGRILSVEEWAASATPDRPVIALLFYRSHLQAGNETFALAIGRAIEAAGATPLLVFTGSLRQRDASGDPLAFRHLRRAGRVLADVVLCSTSFALGGIQAQGWTADALERLGVPWIQVINAASDQPGWDQSLRGLGPLDTAMNVAIPEFDGRLAGPPVSFKGQVETASGSAPGYVPHQERIQAAVAQAMAWIRLRRTPPAERRIAILLTNYNASAGSLANAVGLDAPASLVRLLQALGDAGYDVGGTPPTDPDALMARIAREASYEEGSYPPPEDVAVNVVPVWRYGRWFGDLAPFRQAEMAGQWGDAPGEIGLVAGDAVALPGLRFGNVLVVVQPPRGYGYDPAAIYHLPDLPPPHPYVALYRWLVGDPADGGWGCHAMIHLGKHGTLEWLPGKAVGLDASCYPDHLLGGTPLIYPFIVNDPGEGAQAKRRGRALIVGHMTPPMTTAGGYGELDQLLQLVDDYYLAERLDPAKLPLIQQDIWALIRSARLDDDLETLLNRDSESHTHEWDPEFHDDGVPYTISDMSGRDFAHLVENIAGYLCDLTGAQIRNGLHTLGEMPAGEMLVDTVFHLVRLRNGSLPSVREVLARAWGLDLAVLQERLGAPAPTEAQLLAEAIGVRVETAGSVQAALDHQARALLRALLEAEWDPAAAAPATRAILGPRATPEVVGLLEQVCIGLIPALQGTTREITAILDGLDARYVPPGPSGAPTRGMAHVLPTGRNFYTVDPNTVPSPAAWRVGAALAEELVSRFRNDHGAWPTYIGVNLWGTSAMRTQGDDIAQVLALLGVRPVWQAENRRVTGIELVPLAELGRPRVDVLCRISGMFRDAFPQAVAILDDAVRLVAAQDESPLDNPVRQRFLASEGGPFYRVFGSKPGSYGAGILPLLDAGNWETDQDLADAYVAWGGWAYGRDCEGVDARDVFRTELTRIQAVSQNQDNREHDIYDSDDYLQYHGGMVAAIRGLTGQQPAAYFGDSSDPEHPVVRRLKAESLRVYRSRVVNPKWLEAIQRHGYKGGLEMAATVNYVYGFDVTARVAEPWMYEGMRDAYVADAGSRAFLERANPWALRDIAGRLLEAADRGRWQPDASSRAELERLWGTALQPNPGLVPVRVRPAAGESPG